jgi:hypothetical protein
VSATMMRRGSNVLAPSPRIGFCSSDCCAVQGFSLQFQERRSELIVDKGRFSLTVVARSSITISVQIVLNFSGRTRLLDAIASLLRNNAVVQIFCLFLGKTAQVHRESIVL